MQVQELAVLGLLVLRMDSMLVELEQLVLVRLVVGIQRHLSVVLERPALVQLLAVVALVLQRPSLRTIPCQRICVLKIDFLSCSLNHLLLGMDLLRLSTLPSKFC